MESLKFSTASDVWSFAIVMVELYQDGSKPYPAIATNAEVMQHVLIGEMHPQPDGCTDEVYAVLQKCWATDTHARPTFKMLVKELSQIRPALAPRQFALPGVPLAKESMSAAASRLKVRDETDNIGQQQNMYSSFEFGDESNGQQAALDDTEAALAAAELDFVYEIPTGGNVELMHATTTVEDATTNVDNRVDSGMIINETSFDGTSDNGGSGATNSYFLTSSTKYSIDDGSADAVNSIGADGGVAVGAVGRSSNSEVPDFDPDGHGDQENYFVAATTADDGVYAAPSAGGAISSTDFGYSAPALVPSSNNGAIQDEFQAIAVTALQAAVTASDSIATANKTPIDRQHSNA